MTNAGRPTGDGERAAARPVGPLGRLGTAWGDDARTAEDPGTLVGAVSAS
ncbi:MULTISPECIES: hypothetical protein [Streptomyces]|uniref:Uncharacterized protein n=1 Tax=Streptomyces flaveolus TaxID=67297 RepID=A0ABV3A8M3_9ACTN|nr:MULTISPECIES: hypothetical protein [Streptomyces]